MIITDLRMPGGSGEFVIQWILANRQHLRSRVLIVTGDLLSPGLEAFLEKVQIPMLPKPYLLADLIQLVEGIADGRAVSIPSRSAPSMAQPKKYLVQGA